MFHCFQHLIHLPFSDGDVPISRSEFEKLRSFDPSLSPIGERQVKELGRGIQLALKKPLSPAIRELRKRSSLPRRQRVVLAVSPMKRTLLTAIPIVESLEHLHASESIDFKSVDVVPYIYEIGGCYSQRDGVFQGHRGMTDAEAKKVIGRANVPASMSNGWWSSDTRETEEELEARVTKTVEWIRRTAWEGDCDVLVMVTHQDFACTCMRRLANVSGITWLYNTSTSSFTLTPLVTPDLDPEALLKHSDSSIGNVHHCKVTIDWLNAADHLSEENIS